MLNQYLDADLGYKPASGTATIGNYVWSDFNSNGLRDAGEAGIDGVTVELWRDINGDGIKDAGDAICTSGTCGVAGTTTTSPDGSYLFAGVTAGGTQDYIVYIDETQAALSGYTRTTPPGSGLFSIINISSGASILYANFGYHGTTYTIKDRVWLDADGNKSQNGGEAGISGVTIDLLDASLNVIATATTDANGDFTFSGVIGSGADYTIKITDTNSKLVNFYGTTASAITGTHQLSNLVANVDRTSYPGTVALTNGSPAVLGTGTTFMKYLAGEQIIISGVAYTIQSITDDTHLTLTTGYVGTYSGVYSTLDFGYSLKSAIGSKVFNDINNNGIQDAGDNGFSGVTVKLYSDNTGATGVIDGTDALVATLTTDADGNYLFTGLSDGKYIVSIEAPPSGYTYLGTDSDAGKTGQQLAATISSGNTVLDRDFRYQAAAPRSVSGTIWNDANADGSTTSEAGVSGVTVELLQWNTVIAATTTAADGSYSFSGLASSATTGPGTVAVTNGSAAVVGNGTTFTKNLVVGQPITINSVVYTISSITDDTHLTLTTTSGTTASGIAYSATSYTVRVTDNDGVLSGYSATYEDTEGTTSPFNGQETVDLSSGNQTGINFGYFKPVPTLVILSDFRAYTEDGKVRVQWTTSSEIDTAGFFLFRLDESTGEVQTDQPQPPACAA